MPEQGFAPDDGYTPLMRAEDQASAQRVRRSQFESLLYVVQANPLPCPAHAEGKHEMHGISLRSCLRCGLYAKFSLEEDSK